MKEPSLNDILDSMERYGGSFVKSLAECIRRADAINEQKLLKAFPEYVMNYSNFARRDINKVEDAKM